ncbi:hypothetical protein BOTBODRAFT_378313 [Botryobasidium botryosum FD-172 SS1]|uniref:B30.2/SPRY domain-containing protein n=1 Tax=Botryobasidium botryosum (strain FD-172 SS1) TaxID=930990 RepID=A0A067MYQ4_BOTB1|nr:hypothetical protein BOTBODRAFT_378313 [Botryobasidium botryosum FD-172 SS1]
MAQRSGSISGHGTGGGGSGGGIGGVGGAGAGSGVVPSGPGSTTTSGGLGAGDPSTSPTRTYTSRLVDVLNPYHPASVALNPSRVFAPGGGEMGLAPRPIGGGLHPPHHHHHQHQQQLQQQQHHHHSSTGTSGGSGVGGSGGNIGSIGGGGPGSRSTTTPVLHPLYGLQAQAPLRRPHASAHVRNSTVPSSASSSPLSRSGSRSGGVSAGGMGGAGGGGGGGRPAITFQPRIVRGTLPTVRERLMTGAPLSLPAGAGSGTGTGAGAGGGNGGAGAGAGGGGNGGGGGGSSGGTRTHRGSSNMTHIAASTRLASPLRNAAPPTQHQQPHPIVQSTPFPRPSYLDHSALRDYIYTTPPPPPKSNGDVVNGNRNGDGSGVGSGAVGVGRRVEALRTRHSSLSTRSGDSDEEENESPQGTPAPSSSSSPSTRPPRPLSEEVLKLPTRWNELDRFPPLTVGTDGREISFLGNVTPGEREAAAVRADNPIPPACGIYYYEVEILNKGVKGHIGIGFGTKGVQLNRLPGWEHDSWGYHGDDGHSFPQISLDAPPYGPRFSTGDIIGCGIDFTKRRAFYTKNGAFLGLVFDNLPKDLYPLVGLRTPQESVRVNFGQQPFKFDIDAHVQQVRDSMWAKIQTTRVSWHRDEESRIRIVQAKEGPQGPSTSTSASANAALASSSSSRRKSLTISGAISASTSTNSNINAEAGPSGAGPSSLAKAGGDMSTPLKELVLDYLIHHGYARTARAFRKQSERGAEHGMAGVLSASVSRSSLARPGGRSASMRALESGDSMDMDDADRRLREYPTDTHPTPYDEPDMSPEEQDTRSRQKIIEAILAGDIDSALADTKREFPAVLDAQKGLMHFKLKCRAFVELLLGAAAALKKVKLEAAMAAAAAPNTRSVRTLSTDSTVRSDAGGEGPADANTDGDADVDDMDVDMTDDTFDSPQHTPPPALPPIDLKQKKKEVFNDASGGAADGEAAPPPSSSKSAAQHAQVVLGRAVAYGQTVHAEYVRDTRPTVQSVFKRTFSLLAYEDPLGSAPPEIVRFAGQSARVELADELNRAILESQERATKSTLESVYRQAMGSVIELGLVGVGAAAYADADKEFLQADF